MLARYIQYVDTAPSSAFLWSRLRDIVRANGGAWELTNDLVQNELVSAACLRCAQERRADVYTGACGTFLLIPLLDERNPVEYVIGVAGVDLNDIPKLLHDLHENLRYFSQTIHLLPQAVLTARPGGTFDYASRRWYQISGDDTTDFDVGTALRRALGVQRAVFERNWQRGVGGGEIFSFEIPLGTARGERWFEFRAAPAYDGSHIRKWIVTLDDVDERVQARAEVLRARARLAAVAEIGTIALDRLSSATQLVNRALAAAATALEATWSATFTIDGKSYTLSHPRDAAIPEMRQDHLAELTGIVSSTEHWFGESSRNVLRAPMDVGEAGFQQLVVASAPDAEPFTEFDVDFVRDVASRIGSALRNLTDHSRNARIARVLQTAMLPVSLPRASGVSFDVSYVTAGTEALIGGDWYDGFELHDGRLAFSIGDVAGHGLDAAVIMGHVRELIRTQALRGSSAAEVLSETNRVVMAGGYGLITAVVAYVDPTTHVLEYACAGHPPPVRVYPNGTVEPLETGDVILGAVARAKFRTLSLRLPDDVALVLYTDGLVEFEHDAVAGEAKLHDILSQWARNGFPDRAAQLSDRVLSGARATDDVAMLIVRVKRQTVPGYVRERRIPARSAADSRS